MAQLHHPLACRLTASSTKRISIICHSMTSSTASQAPTATAARKVVSSQRHAVLLQQQSPAQHRHGATCAAINHDLLSFCVQAVVGAGAAGLVSIRELLKEGHQVSS